MVRITMGTKTYTIKQDTQGTVPMCQKYKGALLRNTQESYPPQS